MIFGCWLPFKVTFYFEAFIEENLLVITLRIVACELVLNPELFLVASTKHGLPRHFHQKLVLEKYIHSYNAFCPLKIKK